MRNKLKHRYDDCSRLGSCREERVKVLGRICYVFSSAKISSVDAWTVWIDGVDG